MSKIYVFLTMLFLVTVCTGQPGTQTVVLSPSVQTNVERYRTMIPEKPPRESDETFRETSPNLTGRAYVGKQDDEPDVKNTFRMINSFNLGGIPESSEILSVKLIVTLTMTSNQQNPTYEFEVFSSPSDIQQLLSEAKWNAINQATKILDMGTFPETNYARDYEVGTYYPGNTFTDYIEDRFGGWCHMALKSVDESWESGYPTVHVMDFKNNINPAIGPMASFKLEIVYRPYVDVTFVNDGNFTGPTWDFVIDGVQQAHGYSTLWQPSTEHDIEMNSHSQVPYPTDNSRPYDRVPNEWLRTGDVHNPGAYWSDVTVQATTLFTARHHRLVDNQFLTLYEANGTDLDIPFDIGGQAASSGDIESTYHGEDQSYVVTLPFSHLDQASGRTYFMVNWKAYAYGTWVGGTTNTVTQSISPDLHHKVLYGNPYIAEYQNFMFRSIDNDDELPSVVPTNLSVNNSTKEMSFTIPLSVDVSGVEYVFYGWDDNSAANIDYSSGTVGRSFVLGDDDFNYAMAMSGKYKAHLYSGATFSDVWSVCGTCPNSQRKLDWIVAQTGLATGSEGIYQAVYESSNNIWYTESADHAQTWRPEILVGAGHRPTIANTSKSSYISYSADGEVVTLKYANRAFTDITCLQSAPYAATDAAPAMVIDSSDGLVFVVWETTSGELRYATYLDDNIAELGIIPGIGQNGTPVLPSLAHRQETQIYHLAWREADQVVYMNIKIDGHGSLWHGMLFKTPVVLSNAGHLAEGAPSISVNSSNYPAVSWGSSNIIYGRFLSFRQDSYYGWGTMASMIANTPEEYWAPSVAYLSDQVSGSDYRIAHNVGTAPAVQRLIGGSWQVPTSFQPLEGMHPNTVEYVPSSFSHEVYAQYSVIFQQSMKGVAFSDSYLDRANRSTLSSSRELVFSRGANRAALRLGELSLQSGSSAVEFEWASGFDTLVVGKTKPIEDYLRTEPFTVQPNAVLKYRSTGKRDGAAMLPANLQLVYEVVDAVTQQPLAILQQVSMNGLSNARVDGNYTLPLHSLSGRSVFVRGRAIGLDTTVQVLAIDYYHNPGSTLPRYAEHVEESIDLPTSVQLAQNFPNPFNPTTTIRYNLPEAANVSLMVTDVYGRIVTEIAQGHKAAGTHSAQWDASGQPSGVYYYTLTAGGSKLTKRMHLVK